MVGWLVGSWLGQQYKHVPRVQLAIGGHIK